MLQENEAAIYNSKKCISLTSVFPTWHPTTIGKYVLSFTTAKDQTSKRLLQNDLDLTTQRPQSQCAIFSMPFHLSKGFLLETTKHQHSEILSVCKTLQQAAPVVQTVGKWGDTVWVCLKTVLLFNWNHRKFTTETSTSCSQTTLNICISLVQPFHTDSSSRRLLAKEEINPIANWTSGSLKSRGFVLHVFGFGHPTSCCPLTSKKKQRSAGKQEPP